MSDQITVLNTPSLNLNGGFEEETPIGEDPVGWIFSGGVFFVPTVAAGDICPVDVSALQDTSGVQNTWQREVDPQRYPGYRSRVRVTISAATSFECLALLANKQYFQMFNSGNTIQPPYGALFAEEPFAADADDLPYTISFSVQVLGGRGKIETFQRWKNGAAPFTPTFYDLNNAGRLITAPNQAPDLVVTNLGIGDWRRFSFAGRFGWFLSGAPHARGDDYLYGPVLRFTRQSSDAFVVRITACKVARGQYTEVPYEGDLSYLLEPRGTIYLGYGKRCPPGFRERDMESRFLKVTSQDNVDDIGGSTTHIHNIPVKSVDQAVTSAFQNSASRDITRTNDHSHPVGDGLSVPPSRTVSVCVKL